MRRVSINRPHGDPRHFKVKGRPMRMQDGSVNITCKNIATGGTYWIGLSEEVIQEMAEVLKEDIP